MVSLSSSISHSVSPIPVMRTSPLLVVQTSCALGADNTEIYPVLRNSSIDHKLHR